MKNRFPNTFKRVNCDVWQDRPELMSIEKVVLTNWRPSVHYLKEQEMILHVILDADCTKVSFVFFNAHTFCLQSRTTIEREHFDCAMVVEEQLPEEERDSNVFHAVLFTEKEH